jgi:hypothetical protein
MTNLDRRLELHGILRDILGTDNCYFQPPESVKLSYPCIIYKRNTGDTQYADNAPYTFRISYQVTYIDKDPDAEAIMGIAALPYCRMDRHFTANNLNHDTFNLYY